MESIIERINRNNFYNFHGGIHPPEQKTLTSTKPIRSLPLPKKLILPLQQHIGSGGRLLVTIGDTVLKGQPLTAHDNPMAVPVHAPTSGIISTIQPSVIAHPSGLSELCIFIDVDGKDTWIEREICDDFIQLSRQEILTKITRAGIAGMGGAGFPTHIKVNNQSAIDFLIINAAECEPYITADELLMCEYSEAIVDGIKILDHLLTPSYILIGIEDNKPKAIKALQKATQSIDKVRVCVLPTKYPTGGEKQLIKILTGKEVTTGKLPIDQKIVVQNIATCFAISQAVLNDTPLLQRVVTVTGQAIETPQNVWALLGTPVKYLLEQCGFKKSIHKTPPVIMGGPMMGFSLSTDLVPIVKTSNCILAPSQKEMPNAFSETHNEVECIRCGQCAEVCPSRLLPQELQWSAKAKDYQQLDKLNLSDCIDCGACAYVCPSQIPLVQYYRVAKSEIRQQQLLDSKAEKAKKRFEARRLRLEKEKIAREQKHKKAAAARKAAMNKTTPEATQAKSAVAAALARVKAKKSGTKPTVQTSTKPSSETLETSQTPPKTAVASAIARAKAKRAAKSQTVHTQSANENLAEPKLDTGSAQQRNKLAVIAKAKAKALAKKQQISTEDVDGKGSQPAIDSSTVNKHSSNSDNKKANVAAAIAKAKAKAQARNYSLEKDDVNLAESSTKSIVSADHSNFSSPKPALSAQQDKKTKVAFAIAKAKAKALAKKQQVLIDETSSEKSEQKAKISTYVSREEKKKSEKSANNDNQVPQDESK